MFTPWWKNHGLKDGISKSTMTECAMVDGFARENTKIRRFLR